MTRAPKPPARFDSLDRLERRLGALLRAGVLLSAGTLLAGLCAYLISGASPASDRVLGFGLVCLMATPLMRVLVSMVEYVKMRDWFFSAITVAVLAELAATVIYALLRS